MSALALETLRNQYARYGQEHVFRFWQQLTPQQQTTFLQQLQTLDLELISRLAHELVVPKRDGNWGRRELQPADVLPVPATPAQIAKAQQAKETGVHCLRSGIVGIILVAGGQGTRLGFEGPKGKFPITPVRQKTLFQLHAEKILALSRRYHAKLPWYIMTSEMNHEETKEYFAENHFFGLDSEDVFFFQQDMIPAVDDQGKLFLEEKGRVFTSPNGHGGVLRALKKSGALSDMKTRGVEELFYFQVDNALVRMCDPIFIGYHVQQRAEMSSKVVAKRDPYEKVGVIGFLNKKLTVIEYSDLSREEMEARAPNGDLLFNAGSIAIHMINREFIEQLTATGFSLPYHLAHKKIPYLDDQGKKILPEQPNGYKFEMFIFDALQHTRHSVVMEVARKQEFSPVKNAEGEDSPEAVQQDLCNLYGNWLEAAGISVPHCDGNVMGKVEISPLFALDREECVARIPGTLRFFDGLYLE